MRAKYLTAVLAVAVLLSGTIARSQQAEQTPMTEKIAAGLKASGQLTDYRVGVKYEDGVVSLVGTVTSKEQLKTAVRLTEQMYGVNQVIHDLKVVDAQSADRLTTSKRGLIRSFRAGRSTAPKRPTQLSSMRSKPRQPTNRLAKFVLKQEQPNKKSVGLQQPASQLPTILPESTSPSIRVASSMLEAKRPPSPPDWTTANPTTSATQTVRAAKKSPHKKQPRSASYPENNRFPTDIAYAQQQQPAYHMPTPTPRSEAYQVDNRVPVELAYAQQQPANNRHAPIARDRSYPIDNRRPVGFGYAQQQPANNMPVPMALIARRGNPQAPLRPAGLRQGDPRQGGLRQGDPRQGGLRQGGPRQGGLRKGDPRQGGPRQGGLRQGGPRQGGPRQGGPRQGGLRHTNYMQAAPGMPPNAAGMGGAGMGPMPMANVPGGGVRGASYDQSNMPGYAWPTYASYPNYAALTYPRQYSPSAWPYIGPFYPYPQVPLGWRKVALEWDDGWWFLDFNDAATH